MPLQENPSKNHSRLACYFPIETRPTGHKDSVLGGKSFPVVVTVQYRLDDGKIQAENWSPSTDRTSAFFDAATFNNLLYGHILPHKENTSAPIRKLAIAINEYLAGEIVMQFDMPDPTQVADFCGTLFHKK